MKVHSVKCYHQSAFVFIALLISFSILSCKERGSSELSSSSYRSDLYPLASIEISKSVVDLFGSFPFEFSKEINKPMQEMKVLLTGISSTSVNSRLSTTPNFNNIELNLISVINNKTTLEVFKQTAFSQQQIKFLHSDITTNVGAVTDFYFTPNGFSINTPNRVISNSSSSYEGKNIPVVKQFAENQYQNNIPEIENQIQHTIWSTYQTELIKKVSPIIKDLNDAWYKYILEPVFYNPKTLRAFEEFRFQTFPLRSKFMITDRVNVGEPPEINLQQPFIQLSAHTSLFQNFIDQHIQRRFYSFIELEQIIENIPFMNLFLSHDDKEEKPDDGSTGILFTGSPPVQFQTKGNTLNIYIQGVFYSDGENTKEIIVKIPYIFKQNDTYARLEIGQMDSVIPEKTDATNNFLQDVYSGFRNAGEEISVRKALLEILPTLPVPPVIPIYKNQNTQIGHGFFGRVARIENDWLQFAWEFKQNTPIFE